MTNFQDKPVSTHFVKPYANILNNIPLLMGLNYLQKKNWHPGSLKNQEIVWIREQLQAEIIKKEREREKKLLEEKNIEELKRIQAEAGLIPKSHLDRLEWMYDVGKIEQKWNSTEEYLTGKPITQQDAEKLADQRSKTKNQQQQQYQTIFKEETTNAKCEDFAKVHEDPLYIIMKKEMEEKNRILANPLKVKAILEQQIQKQIKKEKKPKKTKKEKNEKKDKKHEKKRSKKHRSSSSSSKSNSGSSNKSKSQTKTIHRTGENKKVCKKLKKGIHCQMYQEYLKQRLGSIAVEDENGNIKADFGLQKRKYRNHLQNSNDLEEQRRKMELEGIERLKQQQSQQSQRKIEEKNSQRGNGNFLNELRKEVYNKDTKDGFYDRLNRNRNYQERFIE